MLCWLCGGAAAVLELLVLLYGPEPPILGSPGPRKGVSVLSNGHCTGLLVEGVVRF